MYVAPLPRHLRWIPTSSNPFLRSLLLHLWVSEASGKGVRHRSGEKRFFDWRNLLLTCICSVAVRTPETYRGLQACANVGWAGGPLLPHRMWTAEREGWALQSGRTQIAPHLNGRTCRSCSTNFHSLLVQPPLHLHLERGCIDTLYLTMRSMVLTTFCQALE